MTGLIIYSILLGVSISTVIQLILAAMQKRTLRKIEELRKEREK